MAWSCVSLVRAITDGYEVMAAMVWPCSKDAPVFLPVYDGEVDTDVPFMAEHSTDTYSWHFSELCVSLLATAQCTESSLMNSGRLTNPLVERDLLRRDFGTVPLRNILVMVAPRDSELPNQSSLEYSTRDMFCFVLFYGADLTRK